MDIEELKQTDIWELYERSRNYCRMINMYTETDRNYRFYKISHYWTNWHDRF